MELRWLSLCFKTFEGLARIVLALSGISINLLILVIADLGIYFALLIN